MEIAIIGTGAVGRALAHRFVAAGHHVVFGTREPAGRRATEAAQETGASARATREAAERAEMIVLAVPCPALPDAVADIGSCAGRIVVDVTNPVGFDLPDGLASAGEWVSRLLPAARVVKCWNNVGADVLRDPAFPGGAAVTFVSGDDREAVDRIAELATACGFTAVELGGIESSELSEAAARLWIRLAYTLERGNRFAFGLLER